MNIDSPDFCGFNEQEFHLSEILKNFEKISWNFGNFKCLIAIWKLIELSTHRAVYFNSYGPYGDNGRLRTGGRWGDKIPFDQTMPIRDSRTSDWVGLAL